MDPEKIIDAEFEVIRPSHRTALGNLIARGLAILIWAGAVYWTAPRLSAWLQRFMG